MMKILKTNRGRYKDMNAMFTMKESNLTERKYVKKQIRHKEFLKQPTAIFEVLTVHCIIGEGNGGI